MIEMIITKDLKWLILKKKANLKRKSSGLVPTSVRMKKKKTSHEQLSEEKIVDNSLAEFMADINNNVGF